MLNKKERVWRHKYKFITLKCINSISKSMAANFKSFYRTFSPLESYMLCFEQSINNSTVISSFTDIQIISEVFRYMQNIY